MDFSPFDTRKYPTTSVTEGYGEWANTYEDSVHDEMDLKLLSRVKSFDWKNIHNALDLACGTGRIGVWLKQQGVANIDGVDVTAEMLAKAKEKGAYRLLFNGDVLNTKLEGASYDLCTMSLADEHLRDISPLYTEASRLLKPGGHFVIVGYHPFFLMNGLITHFHKGNGDPQAIESYVHLFSDHVNAAYKQGLSLLQMDEGIIDDSWIATKPKWQKYKNRPVSFCFVWKKG